MKKILSILFVTFIFFIAACSNDENASTEVDAKASMGTEENKRLNEENQKEQEKTKQVGESQEKAPDNSIALEVLEEKSLYVLPIVDNGIEYMLYIYANNERPVTEEEVKTPDFIQSKDIATGDYQFALQKNKQSWAIPQDVEIPLFEEKYGGNQETLLAFERGKGAYIVTADEEQVVVLTQADTYDRIKYMNGGSVTSFYHITNGVLEHLVVTDTKEHSRPFALTEGKVKEIDQGRLQLVSAPHGNDYGSILKIRTLDLFPDSSILSTYNDTGFPFLENGIERKFNKWVQDEEYIFGFPLDKGSFGEGIWNNKSMEQARDEEREETTGIPRSEEGDTVPEININLEKALLTRAKEGFLGDIDIKLNTTEKELLSVYPGLEYGFFETDTQFHENYRFFLHSVEDYVYGIEYVYENNTPYTLGEVKRLFGEPDENYENWQQNNLLHIYHSGENWLVFKTEGFTWDNDMPLKAVMVRPEGNFD